MRPFWELSLFSGAGGGLLGTHCLMGWQTIGYVEINDYCQRVIAQRIKDGYFDKAPIFSDIKTFISEGYAASYQGLVDVITAGFPCQPFSVAGKKRGKDDERNLWPETREVIRLVRPRFVLLENVPGLLAHQYFGTILNELAESGYCVSWRCLSAAEVGAPHKRDRVWIVADAPCERRRRRNNDDDGGQGWALQTEGSCSADQSGILAYSKGTRIWTKQEFPGERICSINGSEDVAHAQGEQIDGEGQRRFQPVSAQCSEGMADSSGARLAKSKESKQQNILLHAERGSCQCGDWWANDPADGPVKSRLGRVAHGVAHRVDRLKAIGEGQVPMVVRAIWKLLSEETEIRGRG